MFTTKRDRTVDEVLFDPFSITDAEDRCNFGGYFSLSYKQRLYWFAAFFVIGLFLSMIGSIEIFTGNLVAFAITYSFGNISMILATLFLFGPMRQLRAMCSSCHRALSVTIFLLMIVMTLYAAVKLHNGMACILFLILQSIAYLW